MSTDPGTVRAEVSEMLAQLPDVASESADLAGLDLDAIANRLEAAHEVLARALGSVDPAAAPPRAGPAAESAARREGAAWGMDG